MERVFTYGTLKDPAIQQKLLGRTLTMTSDILPGFKRGEIVLNSGTYLIAIKAYPTDQITGQVLEVTTEELAKLDEYETNAYQRQLETLESGAKAWAYQQ